MNHKLALSLAVISLIAIVPIVQAASTTGGTSPPQGFVAYRILTTTQNGVQRSLSLNESVAPGSNAGNSILSLSVEAASSNFTYSHVVNSSLTMFPYMPGITNQNYTYATKSYTVTARISQQGTGQVTFQGKSYTLTNYAITANIVSANGSKSVSGTVSTFPSDLVYSFGATFNSTQVAGTLTSTSLPLSTSSAGPAVQAASAGLGLSLAGAAVALSLGVRARQKQKTADPSKPDHWVD
ncbi:MAG: hypothetical protein OK455_05460 [Thaumarchaeota archaeon]|nr:hypothetical protein [Nitrososphaerota archaeon]